MKKIMYVVLCFFIVLNAKAQNGVYRSTKFQFISENEPFRNRISNENNTLTIQINEIQGEFLGGKILWEMKGDRDQTAIMEMSLKSIKNSYFDEEVNAFIKVYYAELKLLDSPFKQVEIFVSKFIKDNTYRIDMYDPVNKTINRFDRIIKI